MSSLNFFHVRLLQKMLNVILVITMRVIFSFRERKSHSLRVLYVRKTPVAWFKTSNNRPKMQISIVKFSLFKNFFELSGVMVIFEAQKNNW